MPRAYAASSRSGRRSPPAASNPGGSDSAISSGGKRSGGSSAASQVIMVRASGCRRLARCGQMLERRVCLGFARVGVDGGEAGAIQIGCVAMTQEGHGVKGMYALERSLVELVSVQRHEFDTLLGDAPALAARFLALLGGEALQEVIEIAVRLVVPLKVTIAPQEPAGRLGGLAGRLVEKQAMYRGHTPLIGLAAHPLEQRRAQRSRRQIRPGQQPRAGGRREGHRAEELWIVGQAALLGGARPGEVEHELAPGMLLAIQRCGSGEAPRIEEQQVLGCPAGARAGATGVLEGVQEFMLQERIAAGQRIPLRRGDLADALEYPKLQSCGHATAAVTPGRCWPMRPA